MAFLAVRRKSCLSKLDFDHLKCFIIEKSEQAVVSIGCFVPLQAIESIQCESKSNEEATDFEVISDSLARAKTETGSKSLSKASFLREKIVILYVSKLAFSRICRKSAFSTSSDNSI
ncbi:unnamed protein product [Fraxinus pennsylvanica]|uniref:Uncharacterized protein n=1 Tax=Fraxinus pennsylvanica TaxID=56036 RepID=A0AAD1ZH87_9LAMI|nr:unnamed protein product [Fraxinus pennsylvanica]